MIGCLASTKGDINDTIDSQLGDVLNFLSTQMLSQFHRKAGRQVLLILDILRGVQSNTRLDKHVFLAATPRQLQ